MLENTISLFEHEADMARMERTQSRLWKLSLIMLLVMIGSNIAWIVYFFG